MWRTGSALHPSRCPTTIWLIGPTSRAGSTARAATLTATPPAHRRRSRSDVAQLAAKDDPPLAAERRRPRRALRAQPHLERPARPREERRALGGGQPPRREKDSRRDRARAAGQRLPLHPALEG